MSQVVQDCVNLIKILTEPANRVALEAKLGLAAAWYKDQDQGEEDCRDLGSEQMVEISDIPPPPKFSFALHNEHQELPELA